MICLFLTILSFGQKEDVKIPGEHLDLEWKAREYFDEYRYNLALDIYLKLDSLYPETPRYMYPIAACYLQQENTKALPYVEFCLKDPEKYPKKLMLYAATVYHLEHQFVKAIDFYEKYKNYHEGKRGKEHTDIIAGMDREIEMCKNGIELFKDKKDIKIHSISKNINSKYPDYAPLLTADGSTLYFTSERPNTTGGHKSPIDGLYDEDVYFAHKLHDGTWTRPANMGDSINTDGQDATVSLSPDGHYMLIYRYYKPDILHHASGDLFISELHGDHWSAAERLPEPVNSKYWEPSGSLSADDSKIAFVSNRKGGKGGLDIYISEKIDDNTWSEPKSIGDSINTPYNEDSPYLHPDGETLFFCSTGHNTMGGYDIFYSKYDHENNVWKNPVNLGFPVNTAHDDIHFTISPDGQRIYFSSIREKGQGEKDIYYADMKDLPASRVLVKSGIVIDSTNAEPVGAEINIYNKTYGELLGTYKSNKSTGKYSIVFASGTKYHIEVSAPGYKKYEFNLNQYDFESFEEATRIIKLEKAGN